MRKKENDLKLVDGSCLPVNAVIPVGCDLFAVETLYKAMIIIERKKFSERVKKGIAMAKAKKALAENKNNAL